MRLVSIGEKADNLGGNGERCGSGSVERLARFGREPVFGFCDSSTLRSVFSSQRLALEGIFIRKVIENLNYPIY